ncbi:MAG: major capsid protein [Peptostreptococcaceae bacterium]|nr:major capsid protein [Peptostreptococcaceae bacterium]
MNFTDFINAKEVATYIKELKQESIIGESLFPREKQLGMELKYIRGAKQKPVVLKQSNFDVAVKIRALRAEVNDATKRMPFFKESVLINEEDRQQLLLAMMAENKNMINMIIAKIFDNYKALVDGGDMQMERMRMQLLSNGTINIISKDGDITLDFEVPNEHKEVLAGTSRWSNQEADIVGDIERWKRAIRDDGYETPTRMILSSKTFSYITSNKAIRFDIDKDGSKILTESIVKNYLKNKLEISVALVSGSYKTEDGTDIKYYPDDKITLLPTGTLGKTYYGTTPEEADKMFGSKLDCEIVRTGIAITTLKKADPVTVQTKVSQLGMPSFERADECFFATVN